jgi:hypothetical protein
MTHKGDTWNESTTYRDPTSLRTVRKVTSGGLYNYHPAYHTWTAWTADSTRCVFSSGRRNCSTIFACDVQTGDITQLLDWQEGWNVGNKYIQGDTPSGVGRVCLDAHSGWVYYVHNTLDGTALKAVQIDSLEERTIHAGIPGYAYGQPTVSGDSRWVAVPNNVIPEAFLHGDPRKPTSFGEVLDVYAAPGGSRMQLVRFDLTVDAPEPEIVYDEPDCRGNHLQYSPVDPNLLHTDRDFAPRFWSGSDQKRNRVWLYHIDEQRLVEQPSPSGRTFQVHSVMSFDGQTVPYHCPPSPTDPGGYVIGVNDLEGNTLAEYRSSAWTHYGHVGAVPGRKTIMLDGNVTDDLILWMDYDDPTQPRFEVICRHGTNWGGHEWQYPHPHPQCAPTGDRIVYNAAHRGRSDVYVVEV